jgi:hypothetical protein
MNISPITEKTPACYGICCPMHGRCERYAAVESTSIDHTIATCDDGADGRPLFVGLVIDKKD